MSKVIAAAMVLGAILLGPGVAGATADTTLGTTSMPAGSTATACSGPIARYQASTDGSVKYAAAASGVLTSWQTYAPTGTGGKQLTFLVLRPQGSSGSATVVVSDTETLPSDGTGAGQLDTFPLASPTVMQPGDFLALYSTTGADCLWQNGSIPASDAVGVMANPGPAPINSPPTVGQNLQVFAGGPPQPQTLLDVTATLAPAVEDAAVTTTASPTSYAAGSAAVTSTVTDAGPYHGTVNFTEILAQGLTIQAVGSPGGTCATFGHAVNCTLTAAAGARVPVYVIVRAQRPGTYFNAAAVSVTDGVTDPNAQNNSAGSVFSVGRAPRPVTAHCKLADLRGTPRNVATALLRQLGCRLGKVKAAHSRSVPRGSVLSTAPGPGTYTAGLKINLVVSSGPPPKRRRKH